jgi:hypothetical protein
MILEAVPREEATEGKLTRHGRLYTVDFVAQGLRGDVTIRTGWIVRHDEDFPRLVTCYVA